MLKNKTNTEPIKTVLVICIGFLVIYMFFDARWALNTSLVVGLTGLFSSRLASFIDYIWMKLAWVLSLIVPNILLSVVFFLFLTPLAFVSRIFGDKNPLSLKNNGSSLFKDHKGVFDKSSFEKPW